MLLVFPLNEWKEHRWPGRAGCAPVRRADRPASLVLSKAEEPGANSREPLLPKTAGPHHAQMGAWLDFASMGMQRTTGAGRIQDPLQWPLGTRTGMHNIIAKESAVCEPSCQALQTPVQKYFLHLPGASDQLTQFPVLILNPAWEVAARFSAQEVCACREHQRGAVR